MIGELTSVYKTISDVQRMLLEDLTCNNAKLLTLKKYRLTRIFLRVLNNIVFLLSV